MDTTKTKEHRYDGTGKRIDTTEKKTRRESIQRKNETKAPSLGREGSPGRSSNERTTKQMVKRNEGNETRDNEEDNLSIVDVVVVVDLLEQEQEEEAKRARWLLHVSSTLVILPLHNVVSRRIAAEAAMANNNRFFPIFEQDGEASTPSAPRKIKPPPKRVRQETPSPPPVMMFFVSVEKGLDNG
jgi:hypothetical protein